MNKEENPTADPLEGKLIRDLAAILEETGLSEIEIEKSGLRVRVARLVHMVAAAPVAPALTARSANQATKSSRPTCRVIRALSPRRWWGRPIWRPRPEPRHS